MGAGAEGEKPMAPADGLRIQSDAVEREGDVDVQREGSGVVSAGPGMQRLVALAKKDLAARIGVQPDDIELMAADYVSWPDSSAGCPQRGIEYLQVLTSGSRIRLRAGKKNYHYHSGGNRPPFLCENPSRVDPAPYGPGEA